MKERNEVFLEIKRNEQKKKVKVRVVESEIK
jgi:hypothetical protein